MSGFNTIVNSILTLGLAMLIGFVCVKTGYITTEQKNALSKIIIRITLPVLVVTSLTKMDMDAEKVANCFILAGIALVVIGIMWIVGTVFSRVFKMEKKRAIVYSSMYAFGNVVFMAYPLIQELYGAEGLLYAAVYAMMNDLYLWTLGVYKMASINSAETSIRKNLKNLVNPATIGFVISFIMMIFGLKFTGVVGDVLNGIGGTTTYLSMLFIGGTLAGVDFKRIYKRIPLFVLTAVKMLILPMILIFAFKLLSIDETVKHVIILQAAIPTATILTIVATEYNGDVTYSAEGAFITTIASLATLPLVYYLMTVI